MSDTPPTDSIARLAVALQKLPGIGPRGAERIVFWLLKASPDEALGLADAIRDVKTRVHPCRICYNLTEADRCSICADPRRDHSLIVVVEQPKDLLALEATGRIRGVYHVLMGHIAPLDGVGPDDLTIDALLGRVRDGHIREVVLATNPTMEGDGTALHIQSLLATTGVTVTRLARGLAAGSQIEYATPAMLSDAFDGRKDL